MKDPVKELLSVRLPLEELQCVRVDVRHMPDRIILFPPGSLIQSDVFVENFNVIIEFEKVVAEIFTKKRKVSWSQNINQ
jgi:hypothetical protein